MLQVAGGIQRGPDTPGQAREVRVTLEVGSGLTYALAIEQHAIVVAKSTTTLFVAAKSTTTIAKRTTMRAVIPPHGPQHADRAGGEPPLAGKPLH